MRPGAIQTIAFQDRGEAVPRWPGRIRVDGKFFARGSARFHANGVTYGPFAPMADGWHFPAPHRVADDFARMRLAGINSIRTYHVPPAWVLELADERGLAVLVDVPWPKHLCFLESRRTSQEVRRTVAAAARIGREHPCLLGYGVANEIPPDIIRWHGYRRVHRFLVSLREAVKQADPDALVTHASYPPTEYLANDEFDFATFNVYLHNREAFRRYLFRLQNLSGARPLVLGELGMDTLRHGELAQAEFLAGHLRDARLLGLAGAFVFSWTDDWFTGGSQIHDWAFGITHADRAPKAACHALRDLFSQSATDLLAQKPRVSVIVCTYNGGRTLDQCLRSLTALHYPDYEVIVVDDGSTDETGAVLARYPRVQSIRQANCGLSAARNAGLQASRGSIVAYTDSDCYADRHWLTHLVHRLLESGAAAVGGPNLTPDDGPLAACVAACPGQPVHVLESDQVAEHIPGCNMAFRRDALEAINGFDPVFRKAGDDVDVCWRLQQAGLWITFAPGAVVWHHRRQDPLAYLRQQAGYGEAEALLGFKHPAKFNGRGSGKWRGVVYGASGQGIRLGGPIIYRGTFGTGLFQCIYQPGPAHWLTLPTTLEWHGAAMLLLVAAWLMPTAGWVGVGMLVGSLLLAALHAAQTRLPQNARRLRHFGLVAGLCYVQPLVRSWARYRTRLFEYRTTTAGAPFPFGRRLPLPLWGSMGRAYWSDAAGGRIELLRRVASSLTQHRWGQTVDSGWSDWDLEIYCHPHPWTVVRVRTMQEEHGKARRLVRVRFVMRPTAYTKAIAAAALAMVCGAIWLGLAGLAGSLALTACCLALWWQGTYQAAQVVGMFDSAAESLRWVTMPGLSANAWTCSEHRTVGLSGRHPLRGPRRLGMASEAASLGADS